VAATAAAAQRWRLNIKTHEACRSKHFDTRQQSSTTTSSSSPSSSSPSSSPTPPAAKALQFQQHQQMPVLSAAHEITHFALKTIQQRQGNQTQSPSTDTSQSHVKRHTSHVTRHTSRVTCFINEQQPQARETHADRGGGGDVFQGAGVWGVGGVEGDDDDDGDDDNYNNSAAAAAPADYVHCPAAQQSSSMPLAAAHEHEQPGQRRLRLRVKGRSLWFVVCGLYFMVCGLRFVVCSQCCYTPRCNMRHGMTAEQRIADANPKGFVTCYGCNAARGLVGCVGGGWWLCVVVVVVVVVVVDDFQPLMLIHVSCTLNLRNQRAHAKHVTFTNSHTPLGEPRS